MRKILTSNTASNTTAGGTESACVPASKKRARKTATATTTANGDGDGDAGEAGVGPKKRAKKTAEKNVVKKSVSATKVKEESASASDGNNDVAIGRCSETREDEGVGSTGAEYGDEEGEGEEVV